MAIGQELLNAPFPEMIKSLGVGIAEAQFELDKVSMRITKFMAGLKADGTEDSGPDSVNLIQLVEGGEKYSLLGLGFTPTFYQFVDTVIELKIDISMRTETSSGEISGSGKVGFLSASAVGARYSQKYQYSAEGSSLMRTKLVTIPSPPILEEIIRKEIAATEAEVES